MKVLSHIESELDAKGFAIRQIAIHVCFNPNTLEVDSVLEISTSDFTDRINITRIMHDSFWNAMQAMVDHIDWKTKYFESLEPQTTNQ